LNIPSIDRDKHERFPTEIISHGLAKTYLKHLLTAMILPGVRSGKRWLGRPLAKAACSLFATPRMVAA
jgi:hypothetical protein